MSLFDELLSNNGSALVKQLAQNFNLDESTTQAAIGQMPKLTGMRI
jgi:predicted transcriptional regulator